MEALNRAIEGADAFAKMMEKVVEHGSLGPGKQRGGATGETRRERRARERTERKAAKRAARV